MGDSECDSGFFGNWYVGHVGMVVNKFASEDHEQAQYPNSILSAAVIILTPMAVLVALVLLLVRDWIPLNWD